MGEFNESDGAWKKMVLKRSEDNWVSNIKSEDDTSSDVAPSTTTTSFDLGFLASIKSESRVHPAQNYQYSEPGEFEPDLMINELDPLLVPGPFNQRQRRKRGTEPRKNESPEARAERLARMSAYAAQRLANETPEQRASRLKRMSEYTARRLASETPEQRAKRLARMSEYTARRIASETPEQRKERLKRMSTYAAKRLGRKREAPGTAEHSEGCHPTQPVPQP